MRVLVVDEEIPYPLNSGKRLRTYNLLKHLAAKHQITFICRQHEGLDQAGSEALSKIGIRPIIVDDPIRKKAGLGFYLALLRNLFSRYPYTVTSHYSEVLVAAIKRLLQEDTFDLIHCEWTPYAINLLPFYDMYPTTVDAHNVEAMIWRRNYEVERNLLKKVYIYIQWRKMAAFEEMFFRRFTRCIAVSDQDAALISEFTDPSRIDTVSNGVDISYFHQGACSKEMIAQKNDLVFTGSLDWRPNVDGLLYFLSEIFPLFQTRFPESVFYIVGRNPMAVLEKKIAELKNVVLAGWVDDVRPYMYKEAVYIVPLRVGGGSRLKILEAFSMEMPVVSTTIGAEGLNVTNNEHILLADDPISIVEAISWVIQNDVQARNMAKKGQNLVIDHYQWHVLAERLDRNWQQTKSANTSKP